MKEDEKWGQNYLGDHHHMKLKKNKNTDLKSSVENKVSEKDFNEIVEISSLVELVENTYRNCKELSEEQRKELLKDSIYRYISKEYNDTLKVLDKYKEYEKSKNLKERLSISYGKLLALFE